MASVVLVAGERTEELRKFLEDRGSVDVLEAYESLQANEGILQNKVLIHDKLLYISREGNAGLVRDLQVLRDLYMMRSHFNPREIIFYVEDSEESEGKLTCEKTMTHLKSQASRDPRIVIPDYKIHTFDKNLTFDKIYSVLLGTVDPLDVNAAIDIIYRVDRNADSKKSFEAEDSVKLNLEPFKYKRLESHDVMKALAMKTDSGQVYMDNEQISLEKSDPVFEGLSLGEMTNKTVLVFSGNHRSGVSTFATAMSVSVVTSVDKLLYIDFSRCGSTGDMLIQNKIPFNEIDLRYFLSGSEVELEKGVNLLQVSSVEITSNLMNFISLNVNRIGAEVLVLDVDREDFVESHSKLESLNPQVFLMTSTGRQDIALVKDLFYNPEIKFNMVLSKFTEDTELVHLDMEPERIRYSIKNINKIFIPMLFSSLHALEGYLASKVLEEVYQV